MFDGLCRRVVTSVAGGVVDASLEALCSERTKNNPEFAPLVLEMLLTILTDDNSTGDSHGKISITNSTTRATVLFRYVAAMVKGAEKELENPAHCKLLQRWFELIWIHRTTRCLQLRSLVSTLLLTWLMASSSPPSKKFLPTLINDYINNPVLQGSVNGGGTSIVVVQSTVVPEVLSKVASLHSRVVYDHLDTFFMAVEPSSSSSIRSDVAIDSPSQEISRDDGQATSAAARHLSVKTEAEAVEQSIEKKADSLKLSIEEQQVAVLMLLGLLIQQKVLIRNSASEFCNSRLWSSVLTVLKTTQDGTVMTLGAWFVSLLVPHILQVTTDYLVDFLYIFKRAIVLHVSTFRSSSSGVIVSKELETLEESLAAKQALISSKKNVITKCEAVGRVFLRPASDDVVFSDVMPIDSVVPSRIRKIEVWYGSNVGGTSNSTSRRLYGESAQTSSQERILGIRLSIVSGIDGRVVVLPIRGEINRGGSTKRTILLTPSEFLCRVDVSTASGASSRSSPATGTSSKRTSSSPGGGVGGSSGSNHSYNSSDGVISALRFTTNLSSYPWIGKASREAHLDVSCTASSSCGTDDTHQEIVGIHGVFEAQGGLRSIGVYITNNDEEQHIDDTQDNSGYSSTNEMLLSNPTSDFMLKYADHLLRCLYGLFPWHVLRFLHDECNAASTADAAYNTKSSSQGTTVSFKSIVQSILSSMALHPDIVESTVSELDSGKWHDTLADEFLSFVDSLEVVKKTSIVVCSEAPDTISTSTEEPKNLLDVAEVEFERNLKNEYRRSVRHLRASATDIEIAKAEPLWLKAELTKARDICKVLQSTVDQQRHQMQTFEKEQKKWQLELQLKISKFAHERKQLSEQNIYLQESMAERDVENDRLMSQLHLSSTKCLELESALDSQVQIASKATAVEAQNETFVREIAAWERFHNSQVEKIVSSKVAEKEEIINKLTSELINLSSSHNTSSDFKSKEVSGLEYRVSELELSIKQKDQANYALKNLLERHQVVSEEKLNAVSDKYEHAKAANLALQKRAVQLMEELEFERNKT